jgi:cytochrome P450
MGTATYRIFGLFNRSIVTTSEPQNVQALLATQFNDFDLGPSRRDNFHSFIGNGIFTAEGSAWAHYRAQLKPQFTRDQVSDLESADRHLNHLFRALPAPDSEGWAPEVDLMPMIYRFTMDVSTEFLFGTSVNSQSSAASATKTAEQEENAAFADAMNYCQEYISWRIRLGTFYYLANSKKFQQSCQTVKSFGDKFVKLALERAKDTTSPTSNSKNPEENERKEKKEKFILLDALIAETQDPIELRDQVLQTLLAGRDTTASLISWVLLLLSRSPSHYDSIRATILSHFGTAANPKQPLTFATLKSCKEITYMFYETLRLYPLVPLNGRMALKDTTLPTGGGPKRDQPIAIKRGEQVGFSAYVMHRRHDIWGSDADEWKPERWEGRKLGWEWVGFSGGPRVWYVLSPTSNWTYFIIL